MRLRAPRVIKFIARLPVNPFLKFVHEFDVDVGLFVWVLSAYIPAVVVITVYRVPVHDHLYSLPLPKLPKFFRVFFKTFPYFYLCRAWDVGCFPAMPFSIQK
jgi:hypothetical protein